MKSRIVWGLLISAVCLNVALAETGYIQARQAKILAEPVAKAEIVTSAQKGDAVEIIAREGRWLKVSFGQQQGWVSSLLVGDKPPQHFKGIKAS